MHSIIMLSTCDEYYRNLKIDGMPCLSSLEHAPVSDSAFVFQPRVVVVLCLLFLHICLHLSNLSTLQWEQPCRQRWVSHVGTFYY